MMSATPARGKVILASFLMSIFALALPAFAQGPATLSRTPWQMYRNPIITGLSLSTAQHGAIAFYDHAPAIPPVDANDPLVSGNGGWVPAPNGSTIGFGHGGASRLSGCWTALDFTFFQTLVNIPIGTTVTDFKIAFSGMDDGSRITIFNSTYPSGLVIPGSYVFLSGAATTNLKDYVVVGETNRVVITQVDDCAVGNSLQVADVLLNGSVVQAPTTAPPTFSLPFDAPDGACICTPLLMNTNQSASQTWYVKADASGGPLAFKVAAVAVAPGIAETVTAQIIDAATNATVANVSASYTAAQAVPGFTAESVATVTAAPNAVYRVIVSTPGANPQQAHFRLKAEGAQAIATGSPSSPSFEHEQLTWYFNVGAGENLTIDVLLANPPDSSVSVAYDLFDPSGAFHSTGTVNAPGSISVPGASAGTWALHVDPSAHYRLSKDGGADRGIYLAWDSTGTGTVQATISDGNAGGSTPFTAASVDVVLYNSDDVEVARQSTTSGSVTFPMQLPAGEYTMRIIAPSGFTAVDDDVTFVVTCDRAAQVSFVVADITPPVIDQLPDLTVEAIGPEGTPAFWLATGSDFGRGDVTVTCAPAAGSLFTLGTTPVVCNATDLAGNGAEPMHFTITSQDTTAPTASCTPSYNPSTKNVPRASRRNEDGFYLMSGSDTVGSITIAIGSYTLQNGETVKFTQSPGLQGVVFVNTQGREAVRHFRVGPGDPVMTVTDASGNMTSQTCYVPPIPK